MAVTLQDIADHMGRELNIDLDERQATIILKNVSSLVYERVGSYSWLATCDTVITNVTARTIANPTGLISDSVAGNSEAYGQAYLTLDDKRMLDDAMYRNGKRRRSTIGVIHTTAGYA